jgi:hypothetical protein
MNGLWIDNNCMLGFNSLVDSIARVVGWGGLGEEQLIKLLLLLFVCWKKRILKKFKCRNGGNRFSLITKHMEWFVVIILLDLKHLIIGSVNYIVFDPKSLVWNESYYL